MALRSSLQRALLVFLGVCCVVQATPLMQTFARCSAEDTGAPADQLLDFTSLWAQFDTGQTRQGTIGPAAGDGKNDVLKMTFVGTVGSASQGYSSSTNFLATLITSSSVLNFQTFSNQSALCSSIRTPGFSGAGGTTGSTAENSTLAINSGCPYGPGDIALGVSIPLSHAYPLTTISTKLHILDTSTPALTLACLEVETTPFYPDLYPYKLMLWIPVGAAIGYLGFSWLGQLWASYISMKLEQEAEMAASLTQKLSSSSFVEAVGVIWWHVWSGQGLLKSGSLLRFVTPGARDVIWHIQFIATLGMVAVNWPGFAYPVFSKGAWSILSFNATLTPGTSPSYIDPLVPDVYSPPSSFVQQFGDVSSPLYLNPDLPNILVNYGTEKAGIQRWARTAGIRPQDLFGICMILTLCILAGCFALFVLGYLVDTCTCAFRKPNAGVTDVDATGISDDDGVGYPQSDQNGAVAQHSPNNISNNQNNDAGAVQQPWWQMGRKLTLNKRASRPRRWSKGFKAMEKPARLSKPAETVSGGWANIRLHWALFQGNVSRVLLLFYFPIVLFSVYQLTLGSLASGGSVVLAGVSLAVVGILLPALQLARIRRALTLELVEDKYTVLALGPFYTTFAERSECFMGVRLFAALISGCAIGAGQSHGLVQAVVILVVEVAETMFTSLWLPWGDGAAMGPLAFMLSVTRIITAVILVVLSPSIEMSTTAAGWLTYVILILATLVIALFCLVLIVKIIELGLRVFAHIPFDETRSTSSGGLRGALRRWDRSDGKQARHRRAATIAANRKRKSAIISQRRSGTRPTSRPSLLDFQDQSGGSKSILNKRRSTLGSFDGYQHPIVPFNGSNDDDHIMAAMSQGPWLRATPAPDGFVAPGAYAARPGVAHRSSLSWGDQTNVQQNAAPIPVSSGFAVVRGGKATEEAPWRIDPERLKKGLTVATQIHDGSPEREYPPYAHQGTSPTPHRTRTHSGGGSAEQMSEEWQPSYFTGVTAARPKPQKTITTTDLFANNSTTGHMPMASTPQIEESSNRRRSKSGILGMFSAKRKSSTSNDLSSDDDDDDDSDSEEEEQVAKKKVWAFGGFGKKLKVEEVKPATATTSTFEVVRPPRPKHSPVPTAIGEVIETSGKNDGIRIPSDPSSNQQPAERDLTFPRFSNVGIPAGAAPPSTPGPSNIF